MSARVGRGSVPPSPSNIFAKTGMMNSSMPVTARMAMTKHHDRVGHGGLDLAPQLDLGLVVLSDLQEDAVEEAADLTGTAHVDHERREDLRELAHGALRLLPTSMSLRTSAKHPGELRVLGLVAQDATATRRSDRPLLIIVANCREKTARSLSFTFFLPMPGSLISLLMPALASVMLNGA